MSWQAAIAVIKADRARRDLVAKRVAKFKAITPWVAGAVLALMCGLQLAGVTEPLVKFKYGSSHHDPHDIYDYMEEWRTR